MTALKAQVNPTYQYKFMLIGLVALVIGLYHFIDPIFVYPGMRPPAKAWAELDARDIGDGEKQRLWKEIATENGWSEGMPKYDEDELNTNTVYSYFVGGLFTFIVGIPCLITGLRCLGQWVASDATGLSNAKGQRVAFDQIHSIDKAKWEKKGIAKLNYTDDGQEKTFVIDDLKFDREAMDKIMLTVEETVGIDKIVNGKSEAEYQIIREELAREKAARLAAEEEEEEQD